MPRPDTDNTPVELLASREALRALAKALARQAAHEVLAQASCQSSAPSAEHGEDDDV